MRQLSSRHWITLAVFLVALSLSPSAYADLTVEKTATCALPSTGTCDIGGTNLCTAGNVGQACSTNEECNLSVDTNAIPVGTLISCTFDIEVCSINDQNVENIVVTDNISAEYDVISAPGGTIGDHRGRNQKGSTPVEWNVGNLFNQCVTVQATAVTNVNPSGKHQRYSFCGDVDLNSGPVAKGTLDGHQISMGGNRVTGIVNNPSGFWDGLADTDLDCVPDIEDNCPSDFNPDQTDSDMNGTGDACQV